MGAGRSKSSNADEVEQEDIFKALFRAIAGEVTGATTIRVEAFVAGLKKNKEALSLLASLQPGEDPLTSGVKHKAIEAGSETALKELFAQMDTNSDGELTWAEWSKYIGTRRSVVTNKIFAKLEKSGSGSVDAKIFADAVDANPTLTALYSLNGCSTKKLVAAIDANADGVITISELASAIREVAITTPRKSVTKLDASKKPNKLDEIWGAYDKKLKAEGLNKAAIGAFKYNLGVLTSGADLMIPESAIKPVSSLPDYDKLTAEDPSFLKKTVMVKLNGGLGTGMGLEKAKSLLNLKDGMTFLDFIAQQTMDMRKKYNVPLAFMLMNSFATSDDTLSYLSKYPSLKSEGLPLEFQQNKAPKVDKETLGPASWPAKPECEYCPPGHGDLYPAMLGTGTLDSLVAKGYEYMFVSNSDNLGATMDLKLLTWFAKSGAPFAMECAARTDADKKGGHLAKGKKGGLLLRESAQCPDEDEKEFQNVDKYKFFNTNNLWVNLKALKATMAANDGVLPLPVIKNGKTVDPRDKKSTDVLQLETAMGAAIASFSEAAAILIPRSRFAPVKTTNDMLALMSDAYEVTKDFRMVLKAERNGVPPNIKLDSRYKFVDALTTLVPKGPPSLLKCKKLTVEGKVIFSTGVVIVGDVKVVAKDAVGIVKPGTYTDTTVEV